jgi:hypothetical protein
MPRPEARAMWIKCESICGGWQAFKKSREALPRPLPAQIDHTDPVPENARLRAINRCSSRQKPPIVRNWRSSSTLQCTVVRELALPRRRLVSVTATVLASNSRCSADSSFSVSRLRPLNPAA